MCIRDRPTGGPLVAKTIRRRLFAVPGRLTRRTRRTQLHLPTAWTWATGRRVSTACVHCRFEPDSQSIGVDRYVPVAPRSITVLDPLVGHAQIAGYVTKRPAGVDRQREMTSPSAHHERFGGSRLRAPAASGWRGPRPRR